MAHARLSPEQDKQAARLYIIGGMKQRELAVWFGCGVGTIRESLRREGVQMRQLNEAAYIPTPDEIKAGMAEMRRRGGLPPAELTPEYQFEKKE